MPKLCCKVQLPASNTVGVTETRTQPESVMVDGQMEGKLDGQMENIWTRVNPICPSPLCGGGLKQEDHFVLRTFWNFFSL